mmetsp:Transcript_17113/g.57800  ORF Transcript_17113/g.57800 Transcript_17113/m.57800 type:complete len:210 (-) Transcript_17113:122-751(-)
MTKGSEPLEVFQNVRRKHPKAKAVKAKMPNSAADPLTSVSQKKRRPPSTPPSKFLPEETAFKACARSANAPFTATFDRSMAETRNVLSASVVKASMWSLVTSSTEWSWDSTSKRPTIHGTKSSVTPAKGSSKTMSMPLWPATRWQMSSKSSILRWPPERPAVNSPAMVPPILMVLACFSYKFQYGNFDGSNDGICPTVMYGRRLWYCRT